MEVECLNFFNLKSSKVIRAQEDHLKLSVCVCVSVCGSISPISSQYEPVSLLTETLPHALALCAPNTVPTDCFVTQLLAAQPARLTA